MSDYTVKKLSLDEINIDLKNPRFEPTKSEKDAINTMFKELGRQMIALAKHIAKNGLNPSTRPIVFKEAGRLVDGDSNRRITALKVMQKPDLLKDEKYRQQIKELNTGSIPPSIECVVFENREEARKWIHINHNGQGAGAGTIPWLPESKDRFNNKKSIGTQIIEKYELKSRSGKYWKSTMDRVFGSDFIKGKLGIVKDGEGKIDFLKINETKTEYLVNALRDVKVVQVYTKDLIKEFYESSVPGEGSKTSDGKGTSSKKSATGRPTTASRKGVAPKDFKPPISNDKANDILGELRDIEVEKFPNASAVLLRVFLEFAVDYHCSKNAIDLHEGMKLTAKFQKSIMEMKPDRDEKKVFDAIISNKNNPAHADSFNSYVHNPKFAPKPMDIKQAFNDYQHYFERVYS